MLRQFATRVLGDDDEWQGEINGNDRIFRRRESILFITNMTIFAQGNLIWSHGVWVYRAKSSGWMNVGETQEEEKALKQDSIEARSFVLGSPMPALRPALYIVAVTRRLMLKQEVGSVIAVGFSDSLPMNQ